MNREKLLLSSFRTVAREVPAYAQILAEAKVVANEIESVQDFTDRVPVIDKAGTFGRFSLTELCRAGELGQPAAVLTSSGHSGQFAYSLFDAESAEREIRDADDGLDAVFGVYTRRTLLINCLPMGVYVPTRACTLGATSVRPDMVVAQAKAFGPHYDQIIMVGETAFLKLVLELGLAQGMNWKKMLVHMIVGEEPIAENARIYLEGILGTGLETPEKGMILSSMGVAELGLNLFFELPQLVGLRRMLHADPAARAAILGPDATSVPMIFLHNPDRIHVEIAEGELVLTTLDPGRRIPLIRYRTGDRAAWMPPIPQLAQLGSVQLPGQAEPGPLPPPILIHGRKKGARAGSVQVFPEEIKEAIYASPELASTVTGNFRLIGGSRRARARIQLSPGVLPRVALAAGFQAAVDAYARGPVAVTCERYETFCDGMALDYERKFDYLADGT